MTTTTPARLLEIPAPASTSAAAYREAPLTLILRLSRALWQRIPVVKQSASLIHQWATELQAWLHQRSAAVAAIDDELEQRAPLITRILANDTPEDRAETLALLARLQANVTRQSTHLATGHTHPTDR